MSAIEREKEDQSWQHAYAALSIAFLCLVVGLPLWWKTTTTYRASLPDSEITGIASLQTFCKIPVTVVLVGGDVSQNNLNSLQNHLDYTLVSDYSGRYSRLTFHYAVNVRSANKRETDVFRLKSTLKDLDADIYLLDQESTVGSSIVYILQDYSGVFHVSKIHVGRYRHAFVSGQDLKSAAALAAQVVKELHVNEALAAKIHGTAAGVKHTEADVESMRSVRSTPGYELTFSLLNPSPDVIIAKWDIAEGIRSYLDPFLKTLTEYADFTVNSQVLYYMGLAVTPTKDDTNKRYVLNAASLPHLINPVEAKLGSHVSTNPTLNFLVYVPPPSQSPLHILNEHGDTVTNNAFLSPRWGGIMLYNSPRDTSGNVTLPDTVDVDMKTVMEVFLSQLRLLIGVPKQKSDPLLTIASPDNTGITHWELDFLLRTRTLENVATATLTLSSLSQLLGQIRNMVIRDDIAEQVYIAVESIQSTHSYLKDGNMYRAFHSSKRAIQASETAFFDPSLLELLYFPEDQKFAIYIPLFLPMSIPVLMSTVKALKWIKSKRRQNKRAKRD
uniref:GPI transamidase component PIG-S-like n=1 Tax=Saccoglossus kowalevskii TaxID=10224 RepID=A0ABM0MZ79_SACKO|nr:PREDICTED: GPI transamidase component PIG-S-like [Saccoglossus kowalevskii]